MARKSIKSVKNGYQAILRSGEIKLNRVSVLKAFLVAKNIARPFEAFKRVFSNLDVSRVILSYLCKRKHNEKDNQSSKKSKTSF